MLGIFASFGSIFEIADTSRPEMSREIAKIFDFFHISGVGYLSVLKYFGDRADRDSDAVCD